MTEALTFGGELRRARRAAGLSLAELSTRVHFSKGYLSKVENGLARPNRALATLCDNELDNAGRLCALLPDPNRPRAESASERFFGIPPAAGYFTGRGGELAELTTVLLDPGADQPRAGVCVIEGMAGIGKTALAVRVAHRLAAHFEDCLFLDLQGFRDDAPPEPPGGALDRLLRLLGGTGENIPIAVDDRAARYRDLLRGRRLLIVLDNAQGAEQVRPLLPAEPRCRVLITSRNRLTALDDAHHVSLGLLPAEDAASLFRSVAGAARLTAGGAGKPPTTGETGSPPTTGETGKPPTTGEPGSPPTTGETGSPPTTGETGKPPTTGEPGKPPTTGDELVARVVQRCGRLPLALRIAGARLRAHPAWTLRYLDERLSDERGRLTELDDGERSVAAAFRLSYAGLPPDQQRMFELLALHPGPDIDGYAAAALADAGPHDAERLLDRLLDANLIIQHTAGRYQCHDLVRVFAAQTALARVPAPARAAALDRMLDYYLHTADVADRLLTPHRYRVPLAIGRPPRAVPRIEDRDTALRWTTVELANLIASCRRAAELGRDDHCWQLAFTLRGFFFLTKSWDAWTSTHELAVRAARAAGNRKAEATTLNNLGVLLIERGELDAALANYRRALSLFQQAGDEHGATTSLANEAWVHHYHGEHDRALHDLQTAYQFYVRTGARRNSAITLRGMGLFRLELGAFDDAVRDLEASLQTFNELGLDLDAAMALNGLGDTRHRMGRSDQAAALYRQAILLARECGSRYEDARAEAGLGTLADEAGQPATARQHLQRALELYGALDAPQASAIRQRLGTLRP
jgi:tetratricopeptide (TPR) repeat protein/transcriptional regulator with XRE-family HTH domain